MHATRCRRLVSFCYQQLRRCSVQKKKDIVIMSAVRTPIVGLRGNYTPLTVTQLGAVAIDGALKQSRISPNDVQEVYFGNVLGNNGISQAPARQATMLAGLPKCVYCTTVNAASATGLKTIVFAAQALELGNARAAVAGGMECVSNSSIQVPPHPVRMTNGVLRDVMVNPRIGSAVISLGISQADQYKYSKESCDRARKASASGIFEEELVPVRIQVAHRPAICVDTDEPREPMNGGTPNENSAVLSDGAAALVLTTMETAEKWNLHPLARIVDYIEIKEVSEDFVTAQATAAQQLLKRNNLTKDNIALWEVDEWLAALPLAFIKQLKLDPKRVNIHGGAIGLGHPVAVSGARLVTHLAHALKPGEYGCAAITSGSEGAAALILEKMTYKSTSEMPKLTLYTKDMCPLCDSLLEELDMYFSGQYELEKVYITKKGNEKLLRLYRNDIPVLFLNGQFLCMHRLNVNLLGRKLEELRMP